MKANLINSICFVFALATIGCGGGNDNYVPNYEDGPPATLSAEDQAKYEKALLEENKE